jgi:hypothetical protein
MNALILKILPVLVSISLLIPIVSSAQAQSMSKENQEKVSETVKRQLSLQRPNQEADIFIIIGPVNRVDRAATIAALIYATGVNKQSANVAIELVLTGADPISVGDLMLAMNGLLPKDQSADIIKLERAVEAYNKIIDLADEQTLQSLENNSNFGDISHLLKDMRKAIP